jgi:hypothetical protein
VRAWSASPTVTRAAALHETGDRDGPRCRCGAHRHRADSTCVRPTPSTAPPRARRSASGGRDGAVAPGSRSRLPLVTSRWAGSWSSARVRSTVGSALALRPGRSAQTRLPPTAHLRHAGVRSGVLVLTAGPVSYLYRRHRWLVRRPWRPLRTTRRGERSRPLSACLRHSTAGGPMRRWTCRPSGRWYSRTEQAAAKTVNSQVRSGEGVEPSKRRVATPCRF